MTSIMKRKEFLNRLLWIFALPFILLFGIAIKRKKETEKNKDIRIPADINFGVTFIDEVIVVRYNDQIKVYSSECPHLGCRISKAEKEELICPCHGSKFNMDGEILKGPATASLRKLNFYKDPSGGELVVKV